MKTLRGYVAALLVALGLLVVLAQVIVPLLPWLAVLLFLLFIYGVIVRQ